MGSKLPDSSLDVLFRTARTARGWLPGGVSDELLREVYNLMKMGPTSANTSPARLVFVKSEKEKARLLEGVHAGNVEKTKAAPVTAIVAYDTRFYDEVGKLSPHMDVRPWFANDAAKAFDAAFRNGTLQGAYLMLAARALGLDCGPMSGFEPDKVNAAFFPDGRWKANFLCNLGYGDPAKVFPRAPRLDFDEACRIV